MWCKNCNIETNEEVCPVCGEMTVEDLPIEASIVIRQLFSLPIR